MLALDEEAVICDMAETYQIYDYRRVPVKLLGTLCAGLRDNSRIKKKINGVKGGVDTMLLGQILDAVNLLLWAQTKDAEKGRNRPKSIMSELVVEEANKKPISLNIKDIDKVRDRIIKGAKSGN